MKMKGYRNNVKQALSGVGELCNVVTTGRQGLYKYCNMNECMEMAFEVAGAIDRGEEVVLSLESDWLGAGMDKRPGRKPGRTRSR